MIVLDASAAVELLLATPAGEVVESHVTRRDQIVSVPHLMSVEVTHALRRLTRTGEVDDLEARQALAVLPELPVFRWPHEPLLSRAWDLRHSLSSYDAIYVALAERLGAVLLTADARLQRSPGHHAQVLLVTV